jgi:hypothetical protein
MMRILLLAAALLTVGGGGAAAKERWALVVGIGHYTALPPLPNATNDAGAIADLMRRAGFKATLLIDPTTSGLRQAVAEAQTMAAGVPTALFYYAGHAVQFHNRNFLLAVDADPRSVDALEDQGLELSRVTGRLTLAALRLVFVDACRDNPFAFMARPEGDRGLAPMPAGVGTTIVFAAAPGHVAADGTNGHSPFAEALLAHLLTPGLELNALLQGVAREVHAQTRGRQQLEAHDNRMEPFFFVPAGTAVAVSAPTSPPLSHVGGRVDLLLAQLEPLAGTKRLYGLEDALRAASLQRGLDAGQTLAIMGDIPAPALRRRALDLLISSLLAPISEPETVRLLEGFDGTARTSTIEMLLPCLALPMTDEETERVLADVPNPSRAFLAKEMRRPADRSSCPALRS